MTWLRRVWSFVAVVRVSRAEPPTIAEMRKASHVSTGPRYRQTQPADPMKLRGGRVIGKVRDIHDWHAKYGDWRKRA